MTQVKFAFIGLSFVLVISFYIAFNPLILFNRSHSSSEWSILSVATAYISPELPLAKILKIKSGSKLYIEIYYQNKNKNFQFSERFDLDEAKNDSHIDFKGITSNLILSDLNHDNITEILVPMIDHKFKPKLKVYEYDHTLKHFKPFTSQL